MHNRFNRSCFLFQNTTVKDGSVMGVTHSRSSMLSHCRALTVACNYTEGMSIAPDIVIKNLLSAIHEWYVIMYVIFIMTSTFFGGSR